jgi:hypothetical protein
MLGDKSEFKRAAPPLVHRFPDEASADAYEEAISSEHTFISCL